MKIDLVVFDLDGTIANSADTIYETTLHTFNELNIKAEMPREEFDKKIGMHFEDIFDDFGITVPDFEKFISIYKYAYFDFINSTYLYQGVRELISNLKKRNYKTALLTTKAQDQAEMNLNHFNLQNEFDYIMGRRPGIAHKPSPEPLLKICSDLNIDIQNTIIIGDTEMDILCGKNAGAYTCAVTYGYRTKNELEKFYPDFLIDNIAEIEYIVDGKNY